MVQLIYNLSSLTTFEFWNIRNWCPWYPFNRWWVHIVGPNQGIVYINLSRIYSFQLYVLFASIPQSIVPYLDVILSHQELSSSIMRQDNVEENNMVNEVLICFDTAVKLSPVRQLIPRLIKITMNMQRFVHVFFLQNWRIVE